MEDVMGDGVNSTLKWDWGTSTGFVVVTDYDPMEEPDSERLARDAMAAFAKHAGYVAGLYQREQWGELIEVLVDPFDVQESE
jgi:hypothetical protein